MAQSSKGGVTDKVLKQRIQKAQDLLDGKLDIANPFLDTGEGEDDEEFRVWKAKIMEHIMEAARDAKEELKMRIRERQEKYNQWLEWNKNYQREYKYKIRSGLATPTPRGPQIETKKKNNSIMEELMEPDEISKANAKEQQEAENERLLREWEEKISKGENPF